MASSKITYNNPAPNLPYFTPLHTNSPGTPVPTDPKSPSTEANTTTTPLLFQPLQIRGVTLRNRIAVAPMCQYSTAALPSEGVVGALTPYHIATLGHYALKGAALVFVEATGVQPNGRISPNCPGLWSDEQIPALRAVAEFIASQGATPALQLAHAGRKSSTCAPFVAARQRLRSARAEADVGGWPQDVVGPSGGEAMIWDQKPLSDPRGGYWPPRELSVAEIQQLVQDFASTARRAIAAGIQVLELHAAHGYLLHQFLSPVSNRRTDGYGGSFANRTRLLREVVAAVRAVIPASTPLFVRVSATDWLEDNAEAAATGSWTVDQTVELARELARDGAVDLLDVSSGGSHPAQRIDAFSSADYQTKFAAQIRAAVRGDGHHEFLVGAVGLITEAEQARDILEGKPAEETLAAEAKAAVAMTERKDGTAEPMADLVLVARQFMREPEWVLRVAAQLGVEVAWPVQFLRVRFPKL